VASGRILRVSSSDILHGRSLGEDHVEVLVETVIQEDFDLPFPIKNAIFKMRDARDLSVIWNINNVQLVDSCSAPISLVVPDGVVHDSQSLLGPIGVNCYVGLEIDNPSPHTRTTPTTTKFDIP